MAQGSDSSAIGITVNAIQNFNNVTVLLFAAISSVAILSLTAMNFWATLVMFAVTLLANEYLRPKPKIEEARPSNLSEFQVPTTEEGRKVSVFWGRVRIDGPNVVWLGDFRQDPIFREIKTGLWTKKEYLIGYRNHLGWQQIVGRGGGSNISYVGLYIGDIKVWTGNVTTNTTIQIDLLNLFGGDDSGGGFRASIDFFVGSTTQPVSAYLSNANRQAITTGITQTAPRYTGIGYMVIRELGVQATDALGAYVGTTQNIRAVGVEAQRIPDLIPGQTAGTNIIGSDGDANLICAMYELLTNNDWGLGRDPADFDTGAGSTWVTAAETIHAEGNGFSMIMDFEIDAEELLREMERQADGVVDLDLETGKWVITLAREDFDIDTVPQINDENSRVNSYVQSSWEQTTNEIQLRFAKRSDEYKESHALAQDMASAQINGGGLPESVQVISSTVNFPGVKDSTNAANLAWRELRSVAFPVAQVKAFAHRDFWNLRLGSIVAWSSEQFGIVKKAMRVVEVDLGTIEDDGITLALVEDTTANVPASYGEPAPTQSPNEEVELQAIPADEQIVIECPAGIYLRDPSGAYLSVGATFVSTNNGHVFVSAARQANEVGYRIYNRVNGTGNPFLARNDVQQFAQIGTLLVNLPKGESNPRTSFTVTAPVSVVQQMQQDVEDEQIGLELLNLILVGGEFMLVRTSSFSSGTVTLTGVFRGVLDSAQESHSIGDKVFFLFTGSALMSNFANFQGIGWITSANDIQLRTISLTEELAAGLVNEVVVSFTKREARPYPPGAVLYDGGAATYRTPSLEDAGGPGLNDFYVGVRWWRRTDYLNDEMIALTGDTDNLRTNTEYRVEVRLDPDGADTQIFLSSWLTGTGSGSGGAFPASAVQISRLAILNAGGLGQTLRVLIRTRHDWIPVEPWEGPAELALESARDLEHDIVPTSSLTGQVPLGTELAVSAASAEYTTVSTGVFTVTTGAAASIQYQVNATGPWTSVSPSFTVPVAGDTIRLRCTSSVGDNFASLNDDGVPVAWATFA